MRKKSGSLMVLGFSVVVSTVLICACRAAGPASPADQILVNARVYTVNAEFSRAEAVALRGSRIVAVGSESEVRQHAGPATRIVDLGGRTVVPGLADSHNHQISRGIMLNHVDLTHVRSIQEILDAIAARIQTSKPGEWIQGTRGWWEYELKENRYPTRWELDAVSPNNPVSIPGPHYIVVNSKALELAKITRSTPNPPGGEIYHDKKTGEPDGLLMDRAGTLVRNLIPDTLSQEQIQNGIREILRRQVSNGLTLIREPGLSPKDVQTYRELLDRGELPMRMDLLYRLDQNLPLEEFKAREQEILRPGQKFGEDMIRIDGIKMILDGAERSALLREPYPDRPDFRGLEFIPTEKYEEICAYLNEKGWRVATHVVGDAAIDQALDAYEFAHQQKPIAGKRWSLEHAFLVRPDHYDRSKGMELVINTQYMHNYSLGKLILEAWKEPMANLSIPIKGWIDHGLVVAGGSDGPISYQASPLLVFYGSVTRNTGWGGRLGPDQGISREQALRTVTINAAYASFLEKETGSLEQGKYADLVVLSGDLMTVPEEEIRSIEVLATMVGGRVVFQKEGTALF